LDFAGCGLSEGEYISLGWFEREDVEIITNHLRSSGTVSTIGIWGRSMGAVTALMYADRDPSIAGLVLDSAFSSLRKLAEDLCK
jgi:esterase/lipase